MSRAEQKARTRASILGEARALFVEKGYAGTSIRDVAQAAGVGVGSVHAHFTNKKALLLSCFMEQLESAVEQGLSTLDRAWPLVDQLVHLAHALFAGYAVHPELSKVMFTASLFPEEPGSDPLLARFLGEVSGIFRASLERGEIERLPGAGLRAAQGFFAAYMAVLVGGLGGMWGPVQGAEAADAWAAALRPMLTLQLVGLGADESLLEGS